MTGIGLKKPYKTRSQFKKKIPYISLQCECFVHKLKVQKKKKKCHTCEYRSTVRIN